MNRKKTELAIKAMMAVMLTIIILAFIGYALMPNNYQEAGGIQYRIFHIEGMPCVEIRDGTRGGYSCDWSKWNRDSDE